MTTSGEDKAVKPRPNNSSEPMDTIIWTVKEVKWHPPLPSNTTGWAAYWTHVPPGTRSAIVITWSAHNISNQRFIFPGLKRVGWMIPLSSNPITCDIPFNDIILSVFRFFGSIFWDSITPKKIRFRRLCFVLHAPSKFPARSLQWYYSGNDWIILLKNLISVVQKYLTKLS